MSVSFEDASVAATLALVPAAGIPGYTTGDKVGTAIGELTAWEHGPTTREGSDMAFLQHVDVINSGGAA